MLRDVLTTHRPYKAFGAAELRRGAVPAVNPTWAMGQPFRGNPNALAFYPGNLLYLVLPFDAAFQLHYALHWLLGFFGMRRLARALGQSEGGALLAALAWAGSGYFLSLLTFYNLVAVGALAPWAMAGLVRGGRRGLAEAGLAIGLVLLGGEPVTAVLLLPAFACAAAERRPPGRAVAALVGAGALGLVVAAPQLVATARVLGFTFRSAHGVDAAAAAAQALHPARLLELVLPLPWGWPSELGRFGYWTGSVTPHVPYVYSLHVGVVALAFAFAALRGRARWALLAAAGLAAAWAGGLSGEVTATLTFGLFRYPQKALVLFTVATALLAGWGFDRVFGEASHSGGVVARRSPRATMTRALAGGGTLLLVLAAFFFVRQGAIAETFRAHLAHRADATLARTATAQWTVGFALAGLLALAAAWAVARGRATLAVALQALGLLGLAPALATAPAEATRGTPPFAAALAPATTLVSLPALRPSWEDDSGARLGEGGMRAAAELAFRDVEPAFGVPLGLRYPLAPDLEGMSTPLTVLLLRGLPTLDWPARVGWLRRLGVAGVVRAARVPAAPLERLAAESVFGAPREVDRVPEPLPFVRWPDAIEVADGPAAAFARASGLDPGVVVASRPVAHRPGATVSRVAETSDRVVVDVVSEGGLLVIQRAFLPLYRARIENGAELATQPVDVALLGVEVPAGEHRVVVDISRWPENAALAAALLAAAAAGWALRGGTRRSPGAERTPETS